MVGGVAREEVEKGEEGWVAVVLVAVERVVARVGA